MNLPVLMRQSFIQFLSKEKFIPRMAKTAELNKLVENAYRDVNIAFVNELSLICDDLNIKFGS
ncbi:MAG: hypothetical protein NC917_04545 [Candidatus Omnitrophica bacterium]|nr:hypothetical protein [Candidatus Omnitrophota bacterium]